jgi:CHAT domain-containing protein
MSRLRPNDHRGDWLMSRKIWIHKSSFKLICRIGWRLAVILVLGMPLVIKNPLTVVEGRPAAQDQKRLAAQKKFEEGEALREKGTPESLRLAVNKYEESLQLWRATGARDAEAATLAVIGLVYISCGEGKKALDFLSQALPLLRAAGKRSLEANTLVGIGSAYGLQGEHQKGLDFYNQALSLYRALGDRHGEATTLNRIGAAYGGIGDRQKAIDLYNKSLPLLRAAGDRSEEAMTLIALGAFHISLGETQKALASYNRALPLYRALGDRGGEGMTLVGVGDVYHLLGENQKALDLYNEALKLHRAIGGSAGESQTLKSIGNVYNSLGETRKALDFYNQALMIARAAGDRVGEVELLKNILDGSTLVNIGAAHNSLGETRKALDFYNQALTAVRATGDQQSEISALINIGNVYKSLGETQKALDFWNQSLSLSRATGDRHGEAITLISIGAVHTSQREYQEALDVYNQALKLSRAIGFQNGESLALGNIAMVEGTLGKFEESRSHMESALKIIESVRAGVVSKELRASYLATAQERYEFYIDLLMRMHGVEPAKGHDAAALRASERFRARSLLDSLAEARADIRRGADPELLEQERSLQQRLNTKAEEALKLSAKGAGEERLSTTRQALDALTVELQQVQTRILQTGGQRYGALTQPQPLALAEIQRQALDADTLLLEYSLGEQRSFLWAVTPSSINTYELPNRTVVEAAAKRVYELLSTAPGVRRQAARPADAAPDDLRPVLKRKDARIQTARPGTSNRNQLPPIPRRGQTPGPADSDLKEADGYYLEGANLSRMLLGPVVAQLGKKRLVIVADGALHYIPFGALPDPNSLNESAGNWRPLLVEHEVVNLPSASTIAVLRRELAGRKPAANSVAMLADPVFTSDDERVRPAARLATRQTATPNPVNESIARKLGQAGGLSSAPSAAPGELRINRLPFTRQEAEQIMALAPAGSGMKALDFQASRATVMNGQLSRYRYIHFATHGLADGERPELSTILFSLYDEQGTPQDGFLRAHEVYNLELPAELVTLSACETGLGKLTKGEGLVSLTRGFMYAGAARVVVSLWSVNDRATSELMVKFYRRMLSDGERPAAALRAAQVEMWRDKRWEAPYYWAAFTLQGEWR